MPDRAGRARGERYHLLHCNSEARWWSRRAPRSPEGRVPRTEVDEELLEAVRATMRISLQAADEIGGVSVVQLRALTVLHRTPSANLAQLAEGMGVTVSTTSRLVDRLVAAGLVDRRTAAHTRREISLRLTARGRSTLARYDDLRLASLQRCLQALPDGDRETVTRGLRLLGVSASAPVEADAGR
jgi:DNA-binding MarR family transcriptional regulator